MNNSSMEETIIIAISSQMCDQIIIEMIPKQVVYGNNSISLQ